jgi:phosphoribosylformimino-5-aminoimidazole carboxamide ribotide isomerase
MNRAIRLGNVHIIAAGGISSLQDLISLDGIGVYGVVIGKALYEGKIRLADAFKILRK